MSELSFIVTRRGAADQELDELGDVAEAILDLREAHPGRPAIWIEPTRRGELPDGQVLGVRLADRASSLLAYVFAPDGHGDAGRALMAAIVGRQIIRRGVT